MKRLKSSKTLMLRILVFNASRLKVPASSILIAESYSNILFFQVSYFRFRNYESEITNHNSKIDTKFNIYSPFTHSFAYLFNPTPGS